MSRTVHTIYLSLLVSLVALTLIVLIYRGMPYYSLGLEDRVYHPDHALLKPSGLIGHGLGIAGSLCLIIGMASYMIRKRYRYFSRLGLLKHWLEFHIFLCTLGPLMVLFHTSYKFGGLVAISFWSMVAVFFSGIVGRFIYLQIPHTIEGQELSLSEVKEMKTDVAGMVRRNYNLDEENYNILADSVKRKVALYHNPVSGYFQKYAEDRRSVRKVKDVLKRNQLPGTDFKMIISLVKNDIKLNRKIERLDTMQNLFKYWHVAHLPFALVMLIIMFIHVAVTIAFGYRWIF